MELLETAVIYNDEYAKKTDRARGRNKINESKYQPWLLFCVMRFSSLFQNEEVVSSVLTELLTVFASFLTVDVSGSEESLNDLVAEGGLQFLSLLPQLLNSHPLLADSLKVHLQVLYVSMKS